MGGRKSDTGAVDREAAKQERIAKQQEAARQRKQAAQRKRFTKGLAVAVVVVGAVAWMVVPRAGSYTPGSSGETIEGVLRYSNPTGHTLDPVVYPQTPPAGGEHNPTWLNCGVYSEPVPNTYAVHALEHGAVWVTYDPSLSADELDELRRHMPSSYVVLSPYVGLPSRIVLSAWNAQLSLDSPTDARLPRFFEEYWRSQYVPEPGALCTGGVDGPGRTS